MSKIAVVEPLVVNVSPKTNWTFVAVTTDDGHTGWGEASLNRWEGPLVASIDMLARDVVGSTVDSAFDAVRYVPHSPGGLVMHAAKSSVEQALTDVLAQCAQRPVHALIGIGGEGRDRIPAYANINRGISTRSPAGFAAAARAAIDAGYGAIKIAPFDGVIALDAASTPIDALIRAGLDRVYAVRDAIGGDRALMVDCHWRFDEQRASSLIRDLGAASPYWIECPISEHPTQFGAIARLRHRAAERGNKLAGGETITGGDQATAMCAAALYDVLMPDIKYAGGYRGMLSIAGVCADNGVAFAPHNPTGPIAHVASIHACAAARSVLWLEHQWAESPLFDDLIGGNAAPLVDGAFVVPRLPGLGARLDRQLALSRPARPIPRSANLDERLG
jgi:galactonate dehydratase